MSGEAAPRTVVSGLVIGLPAYVLIKALIPGFHAREDTMTPVKIAIVAVIANVALALTLMQFLAHAGIALATALTAWFNAAMLGWILVRRGHLVFDRRLVRRVPRLAHRRVILFFWPIRASSWNQISILAPAALRRAMSATRAGNFF